MGGEGTGSIFEFQGVYVHCAIRGLSGDEFVQRIPGDALNVVVVLGNLSDHGT